MLEDLKILLIESTDGYRSFLLKVIANIDGVELTDTVSNGRHALAKLKQAPVDLVLLQMESLAMTGVTILETLRESYPETGVIAISASDSANPEDAANVVQMGALDFISGFGMDLSEGGALSLRRRLMTLIGLYRARRNSRLAKQLHQEHLPMPKLETSGIPQPRILQSEMAPRNGVKAAEQSPKSLATNKRIDLLAIGVSTGGPNALAQLIPLLPADLGIPLLIVQHMPAIMTASLAESLNKKSAMNVREAADGEEVLPNVAYVASGGFHMTVASERTPGGSSVKRRIQLNSDPPENSCRPSVDVLFRSLAHAYCGTVLAVIMTGMGSDGMKGVLALKQNKCYCISQTEETCVVYGMPRAVVEAGLSDEKIPLHNMACRIMELVRGQDLKREVQ
ncbi:Chemotaxis response regulator protein-glutamate methylesterase [Syntrophobacter sp. SbD1]|nr:Chemotaxis response regulator protein-glutamate methylesterase [Syntrophobacter sp. SbD1]